MAVLPRPTVITPPRTTPSYKRAKQIQTRTGIGHAVDVVVMIGAGDKQPGSTQPTHQSQTTQRGRVRHLERFIVTSQCREARASERDPAFSGNLGNRLIGQACDRNPELRGDGMECASRVLMRTTEFDDVVVTNVARHQGDHREIAAR